MKNKILKMKKKTKIYYKKVNVKGIMRVFEDSYCQLALIYHDIVLRYVISIPVSNYHLGKTYLYSQNLKK